MKNSRLPPSTMVCGNCLRTAAVILTPNGWRWDCWHCRWRSWDPQSPMVSRETLRERQKAHEALDPLWKASKGMTEAQVGTLVARSKVYRMIAEELGLSEDDVHLFNASEEVASQIVKAVGRIKGKLLARSGRQIREDYRERGREMQVAKLSRLADDDD